ncbi:MAG TPA: hypothetical protein PLI53_05910 [Geobacteraceae bacterium]|nr:hypothetical protein [Geobacteraceae bacterium]
MSEKERPQRLCSEIQLFDLCSKETCTKKKGRYCTDETLLDKFEAISQEEDFSSDHYFEGEPGDEEDGDYPGFGGDYDDDEDDYGDEA